MCRPCRGQGCGRTGRARVVRSCGKLPERTTAGRLGRTVGALAYQSRTQKALSSREFPGSGREDRSRASVRVSIENPGSLHDNHPLPGRRTLAVKWTIPLDHCTYPSIELRVPGEGLRRLRRRCGRSRRSCRTPSPPRAVSSVGTLFLRRSLALRIARFYENARISIAACQFHKLCPPRSRKLWPVRPARIPKPTPPALPTCESTSLSGSH